MTKFWMHFSALLLVVLTGSGANVAAAQSWQPPRPPATKPGVGQWGAAIVRHASELLKSPAQWNREDNNTCPAVAQTFSIACALQKALEEGVGIHRDRGPSVAGNDKSPRATCLFHATLAAWEGSCGAFFNEIPIFTIKRTERLTSGAWRTDIQPMQLWSGRRSDAQSVVEDAAEEIVSAMKKNYADALVGYNNDSTTTFADVKRFFQLLERRVAASGATALDQSGDPVEIDIYPGGTGVLRIITGWYAVTGFATNDSTFRFQVDTVKHIPPSALDRQILMRAATMITNDSVWNRADNRKCTATAKTWSIFCAVEQAEVDLAGGFHHRRPAMELVREIVDERTQAKSYQHRLMEYNNDPTTKLDDVRTLFAEAIKRIGPR